MRIPLRLGHAGGVRQVIDIWTRWGIRKQLTAVSIALVAIPLSMGIVLLANLLTRSLSNSLVTSTKEVAHRTASFVEQEGTAALPGELQLEDGYRAQVLDAGHRLLWTSSPHYRTPLADLAPAPGKMLTRGAVTWWGPGDDEHADLVVAEGVRHGSATYVVLVATSQEDVLSAVSVTTGMLLACVPLVMLAAGLISWWVAGRALRPVDEMNARVARITSSTLDERVPLPVAEDELRSLAITMNQMLERLEASQASQQRFISDASHELRSPMASLSGALEIARTEDDLETWREMAPLMGAETRRLNQLVQGLLTLSRGDDAGLRIHVTELDLDDLAADEAARLRATGAVQVRTRITATRITADPSMMRQVLRNLCDNAARHAAGQVLISVAPTSEGGAILRVTDDGNGIAPADRERVFGRFVRLEESRNRDEGGSGLGLAIVAQIVRAHGGTVRVVSPDEPSGLHGACVEVRLPGTVPAAR